MITLIHAADLHLDSPFRGLNEAQSALRRKEQRLLPARLVALAQEHHAQLILLAGDLFDGSELYRETGDALLRALSAAPCPVFIAPGNHDPLTSDSPYCSLPWPDHVHIFQGGAVQSVPLPDLGCVVHGSAFTATCRDDNPLATLHCPDDGLLHIMVAHGNVNGRDYGPIPLKSIEQSGLDYLALGHVHACSGLQQAGQTVWAYSGCPEGRGFDECGDKGVLLCQLEPGRVTAEFLSLCTRRYERLDAVLSAADDPEYIARTCLSGHEQDICRLTFCGEAPSTPNLAALEQALSGSCFSLSLRDESVLTRNLWARAEDDNLTGLFLRSLQERLKNAADDEEKALIELAARFGLAALEHGEDCRP